MEPAAAAKPPRPPNRHRKRRLGAKPSSGTRRERTDVPGSNRPQRQSRHGLPIGIASDASGRNRAQVRDVMTAVRQIAHATDTGRKRRRNEDDYVVEPPLFAVADGMGGAQAGELASSLAASAVREDDRQERGSGERRVVELIQEANRRVYQRSAEDAAVSGM